MKVPKMCFFVELKQTDRKENHLNSNRDVLEVHWPKVAAFLQSTIGSFCPLVSPPCHLSPSLILKAFSLTNDSIAAVLLNDVPRAKTELRNI